MSTRTHVWLVRLILLAVFAIPSLNCAENGCDCADVPGEVEEVEGKDESTGEGLPPLPDALEAMLAPLDACEGGVLAAFGRDEVAPPQPGSEGYLPPQADTLAAIEASVAAIAEGEAVLARALVAVVGYELCRGEDGEEGTLLWRSSVVGTGRALFAWRLHAPAPLVVGVPHPWDQEQTRGVGAQLFQFVRARALIQAGSHRCANDASSGCDGDGSVCGDGPARISDMAYSIDTVYQVAHELLTDAFEADWVLAVDGMGGPGASLDDGLAGEAMPGSAVDRLADALADDLADVTSCNAGTSVPREARTCGGDNVQGRYINGSSAACTAEPGGAGGRFVHLALGSEVGAPSIVSAVREALPSD